MALVFIQDLSSSSLLMAYNNNVVRFKSDSTTLQSMYAEVRYGLIVLTLYPSPQQEYYFNFSDFIKNSINANNMADDLNIDIQANGYIYPWDSKILLTTGFEFRVYLTDLTYVSQIRGYTWLAGVLQLEDYKRRYPLLINKISCKMLSPFVKGSNNKGYIKYWDGYPFDITVYTQSDTTQIKLYNESNLTDWTWNIGSPVNRLAFCDGRTTETIESVVPLQYGLNKMKLEATGALFFSFDLVKEKDNCGVYLKWRNSFGGWNYWLFPRGTRNRSVKDIGELENDFYNIENTTSPTIQIGRKAVDTVTLTTDVLTEDDMILISDMIESPKLYMFTGQQYAQNTFNDWIEVSLKTTDFRLQNAKTDMAKFNFAFELPMRNNITL